MIGRWTTYRLEFKLKTPEKKAEFKAMMSALKEYNIQAQPLTNFNVNRENFALTRVWDFLDTDPSFGDYNLSYPVRYQLESCISHGFINEHNITQQFLEELRRLPERTSVILLETVAEAKKRMYDPMEVFNLPRDHRLAMGRALPEFCVYMQRATVTPTGIHFHTPSVEISNRVIRQYNYCSNRFIRISFSDEEHIGRLRPSDRITSNELYNRIWRTLANGVVIGDRKFEFLAFGNSQLREHGAYFFASDGKITCDGIREWMGDFSDIPYIAKYAARLGQCFSTTKPFKLKTYNPERIDDVERNGYRFTDGVGKISPLLATLITQKMQKHRPTDSYQSCCFQFRLGGCKGILVSWPDLPKKSLQIRGTQIKFWSEHAELEIIRCSQFSAASLNRQLIIVLSNLGAPDQYFRDRLAKVLTDYNEAIHKPSKALEILTKYVDPNYMTLRIADLVRGGFMKSQEPFVISVLHLWRAWTMKYLKEKAKIVLEHGAFLLGCTDETQTLRGWYEDDKEDDLAQIFCQIWDYHSKPPGPRVITGRCVVARNPSLHPGDVRIVEAVDVPALHHLIDVVVFPQTGDRDVPNMLSGGDLDGDDYVVIWDEELVKPGVVKNEPPANYTSNDARKADSPVTITDVMKFFIDYLKNDRLGSIANAHLAHADHQEDGVKSSICLELAQLHSDAVDFPKSGVKASMSKKHRVQEWPHFMEKPEEEGQRISDKILGQLYQMVERVEFVPQYNLEPNEAIMTAFNLTEKEMRWAKEIKTSYDKDMRRIMSQHNINTEFEVWSTFVMSHSGGNDYKFHETIGEHSATLMDRYREMVLNSCGDKAQELPRKVAALYVYTQNHIEEGKKYLLNVRVETTPKLKGKELNSNWTKMELALMPLMSCPWLFADILIYISKGQLNVQNDYEPGKPPVFQNWRDDEDDVERITIEDLAKLGKDMGGLVVTEETDDEDEKEEKRKAKGKGKAVDVGSFDDDDDDDDIEVVQLVDDSAPPPEKKRKEHMGFDAAGNDVDYHAIGEKLKEMELKWEDLE
jgi:RNA-dependent RNA polymerase